MTVCRMRLRLRRASNLHCHGAPPGQHSLAMFPRVAACFLAFHLAPGAAVAASAPAVLNYQGRVSVDGKHFNGPADFVFSIHDTNDVLLWSSGDVPRVGATNPPPGALRLGVREGLYNIRLGDRGAGMPVL